MAPIQSNEDHLPGAYIKKLASWWCSGLNMHGTSSPAAPSSHPTPRLYVVMSFLKIPLYTLGKFLQK